MPRTLHLRFLAIGIVTLVLCAAAARNGVQPERIMVRGGALKFLKKLRRKPWAHMHDLGE